MLSNHRSLYFPNPGPEPTNAHRTRRSRAEERLKEPRRVGAQYPNALVPVLPEVVREGPRAICKLSVSPPQDLPVRRDVVYRLGLLGAESHHVNRAHSGGLLACGDDLHSAQLRPRAGGRRSVTGCGSLGGARSLELAVRLPRTWA